MTIPAVARPFAFLVLTATAILAAAAQAKEVTVYFDDSLEPYAWNDNGKAKGIYPDIIAAAGKRMPDFVLKNVPSAWKRALFLMEKGEAFAIVAPYYRPTERPFLRYSDMILEEKTSLFVLGSRPGAATMRWPDDFKGLRIGINYGFLTIKKFENTMTVMELRDAKAGILNVAKGVVDAYANDRAIILYTIAHLRKTRELTMPITEAATIAMEPTFLAVSNFPVHKEQADKFLDEFNQALKSLFADGTIKKILSDYLD